MKNPGIAAEAAVLALRVTRVFISTLLVMSYYLKLVMVVVRAWFPACCALLLSGRAFGQASFGTALALDGVDQYLSIPGGAVGALPRRFTIESWVYLRAYSEEARLIECGGKPESRNNIVCALSDGTSGHPVLRFYQQGFSQVYVYAITSKIAVPLNQWVHVAFTCDGVLSSILINGEVVALDVINFPEGVRDWCYLGRGQGAADWYSNAVIDDFRMWSVARNAYQIKAGMYAPLNGDEAGLVLYYPFDGPDANPVNVVVNRAKVTGAAYNGSLINGATQTAAGVPFDTTPNTVRNTSDSGFGSLRDTVANATDGSTVRFDPSLSGQTIVLTSGQIVLGRNVTIDATRLTNGIAIDGNRNGRIFTVNGGVSVMLNSLVLTNGDSSIYGCCGAGYGGAINNAAGSLTMVRCLVAGNSASNSAGGGIFNNLGGTVNLRQCTFTGNIGHQGGGVDNEGVLNATQCTFTGNLTHHGYGGAVFHGISSAMSVDQCTISGNESGIYILTGNQRIWNSIVAGNTDYDIRGSYTGTGNFTDGEPLLAPLGDYGGEILTMLPLPGSPVIDRGSDIAAVDLTVDQRGFPRISGAHADIGAVERQADPNSTPILVIIPHTTGTVTLLWQPQTPGYRLQENSTLDPSNWADAVSGTINPVAIPIGAADKYYRLSKP
ncbi:MAG TPA: choice-of-anchor Q domain-containing protein [Candidatus Limnocylindria bacterium]|nr:choice-of-anchor Q domain-containing protein [Candidatus Limnocylindria bacterium]